MAEKKKKAKKQTKKKKAATKKIKSYHCDNPPPRSWGRPPDYNKKYCEWVEYYGWLGLSKIGIAGKLGIARSTLYDWAEKHKEFSDSLERGLDLGFAEDEILLNKLARGSTEKLQDDDEFDFRSADLAALKYKLSTRLSEVYGPTVNVGEETPFGALLSAMRIAAKDGKK